MTRLSLLQRLPRPPREAGLHRPQEAPRQSGSLSFYATLHVELGLRGIEMEPDGGSALKFIFPHVQLKNAPYPSPRAVRQPDRRLLPHICMPNHQPQSLTHQRLMRMHNPTPNLRNPLNIHIKMRIKRSHTTHIRIDSPRIKIQSIPPTQQNPTRIIKPQKTSKLSLPAKIRNMSRSITTPTSFDSQLTIQHHNNFH